MLRHFLSGRRLWGVLIPLIAYLVLAAASTRTLSWPLLTACFATLIAVVLIAVYHAEIIAQRIGEPLGALILALAVTAIETSLIVSLMVSETSHTHTLVRDTVFATVMIICNGAIGLSLLVGALKHHALNFRVEGPTSALAVLATLTTMTMVLPDFTFSTKGPTFSSTQLLFAAVVSLLLYGIFIFVQTVRHRDQFLPERKERAEDIDRPPPRHAAWISFALLLLSVAVLVGLANTLAPSLEATITRAGLPHTVTGIVIAALVLLPETMAAIQLARNNRIQISFNLALGSALATIGLTIPTVAIISLIFNLPMELGLPPKEITLLALTLLLTTMTVSKGRVTILQGAVHLVVFAVFICLAIVP